MTSTRTKQSNPASLRPSRSTLAVLFLMFAIEATLLAWYLAITNSTFVEPRYLIYPFLWINVGLIAVWRISIPPAKWRHRQVAVLLAFIYGVVILYVGGVAAPGYAYLPGEHIALTVNASVPPGWGPIIVYSGPYVSLSLVPFRVIGYLALTYLVYATLLDTASALPGIFGFFACVSCTWPIVAAFVTGVVGVGGGAATAASITPSYDVSTAIFLATVLLLYWRPIFD